MTIMWLLCRAKYCPPNLTNFALVVHKVHSLGSGTVFHSIWIENCTNTQWSHFRMVEEDGTGKGQQTSKGRIGQYGVLSKYVHILNATYSIKASSLRTGSLFSRGSCCKEAKRSIPQTTGFSHIITAFRISCHFQVCTQVRQTCSTCS